MKIKTNAYARALQEDGKKGGKKRPSDDCNQESFAPTPRIMNSAAQPNCKRIKQNNSWSDSQYFRQHAGETFFSPLYYDANKINAGVFSHENSFLPVATLHE